MSYNLFSGLKPQLRGESPVIALMSDNKREYVEITIGKHKKDFDFLSVIEILRDMGAIRRGGEIDINRVRDKVVDFVNELIILEQTVQIIN